MQAVIPLTEKLYVYGPLGIFCAILIVAVYYLYAACAKERAQHEAALKALTEKYEAREQEWRERYVTKAESWVGQYHELASAQDETMRAQKELFEGLMKQVGPRRSGG